MAITLNYPFYSITNKSLFEAVSGNGYTRFVQNPSQEELKRGIYKPRLTLYDRKNRQGSIDSSLRIEFSAPKLMFGNNFQELINSDLFPLVAKLESRLMEMGVKTRAEWLSNSRLSTIHYSKNLILTDHTMPSYYINIISKGNYSKTYDQDQKEYRNGNLFKLHCNNHEIVWYDKKTDLIQAAKSEKRAFEQDSTIQLGLLDKLQEARNYEVLRLEIRLGDRNKIMHILSKLGLIPDLSVKYLFDQAQAIREGYKKKHFKYAGLPYFYRGLIRCADCGCIVTPEKKTKPSGKTYVYYHCTQHFGKHGAEWVSEADLTEQLSSIFDSFKVPEDVIEDIVKTLKTNHSEKIKTYDANLSQLQSEHRRYETMIETIYEDRVIGRITPEQYDKKCIEYRAKQEQLNRKMINLQMADESYYLASEYILNLTKRAKELFMSSEIQKRRELLKLVVQNPKLNGKKVEFTLNTPFLEIAERAKCSEWLRDLDSN